jgi:putative ABC transport system permease protein
VLRAALRSVLARKVRLGLTGLAIVLGVSLVTGTFMFTDTIDGQFDNLFDDIYAGIDVTVRKDVGDFTSGGEPFDASTIAAVAAVPGVGEAEGGVSTAVSQVIDKNGDPIGGQGPPALGFSWGDSQTLNPLRIGPGNGRPPTSPGEVAIDANTVKVNDFGLGDTVTVVNIAGAEAFSLVGIMSFGDQDTLLGATITVFELSEAQRLFGFGDEFTGINVRAEPGIDASDLATRIAALLPPGLEAVTGITQQNEQADEIDAALGFLQIALLIFAGVAVFVGAFIIQNTFRIIVAQRTRELALLRAIGATARQVLRLVMIEAFITAVVASIIGIGVGVLMAMGIRALMNTAGLGIPPGDLVLLPRTIIIGMLVGVALTTGSAILPARRASRVPPVAAMREDLARPRRRSLRNRAITGISVTGVGAVALFVGLFAGLSNGIIYVGIGAAVIFIGVSALAPFAARPVADLVGWPLRWLGISGQLAKENTKRKPRRTASTASALMIGVALVGFLSVFASSIKVSVQETVLEVFAADFTIQSTNQGGPELPSPFSPALTARIRTLPEVDVVSALQFGRMEIDGNTEPLGAVEPSTIGDLFALKPIGAGLENLGEPDTMMVSAATLADRGWAVGQRLSVTYAARGEVSTTIVGSFEGDDFGDFYVSSSTFASNFTGIGDGIVFARAASGITIEAAQRSIELVAADFGNVKVQTKSQLLEEAEDQVNQALVLFTGLLFFAVAIAVLGITNTMALSIYERTREIGLLRAVGMSRRQVRRMVRWESVIIALFGALLGVLLGIFLGWAVTRALVDEGLSAFSIPYAQVAVAFVLAGFGGVVAAVWPAYKAGRLNVLRAIGYE